MLLLPLLYHRATVKLLTTNKFIQLTVFNIFAIEYLHKISSGSTKQKSAGHANISTQLLDYVGKIPRARENWNKPGRQLCKQFAIYFRRYRFRFSALHSRCTKIIPFSVAADWHVTNRIYRPQCLSQFYNSR